MKKDEIFFSESGLTSTSANHIANLAKEQVRLLEESLNQAEFVNIECGLIGSSSRSEIQEGVDKDFLDSLDNCLIKIAGAKSLIAWLREAIKARKRLLDEVDAQTSYSYCEMNNIEYPEKPVLETAITEDDYVSELSVKERNRYYHLETICAVIGKYIHPDGRLADKRQELNKAISHKHRVDGTGRDAIIYTYIPSVSIDDVDSTFFQLQSKHREYQKELNSIKYKIEKAVSDDETNKRAEYRKALEKYNAEMAEIQAKLAEWKAVESQRISALKIVIPISLLPVYESIEALGK